MLKNLKDRLELVFVRILVKKILILMQLQGFICIKHREGIEAAAGGLL